MLVILVVAAVLVRRLTMAAAKSEEVLQFEEVPSGVVIELGLPRLGGLPSIFQSKNDHEVGWDWGGPTAFLSVVFETSDADQREALGAPVGVLVFLYWKVLVLSFVSGH
jgi:hypothetical protein